MKNLSVLSFSLLLLSFSLLSCSNSNNSNDDNPPAPETIDFTYSVEGLISFPKDDIKYEIPLFTSVTYKDALGAMVTEAITNAKWEKTISLKTDKPFSSKLILKYNRIDNPDDNKVSIKRTKIIAYFKNGDILTFQDNSSTMTMSTNQLNSRLESEGDYESTYDLTF